MPFVHRAEALHQVADWHLTKRLPIGIVPPMRSQDIISEIEAYARALNKSPGTVCAEATGNFRLFERLQRRFEQTEKDEARLRDFMANNPPNKKHPVGAAE
jgi:hypothetical protein